METFVTIEVDKIRSIDFQKCRQENRFIDVQIKINDEYWNAHKIVLETASKKFEDLRTNDQAPNIYEINEQWIEPRIVPKILDFLYVGHIEITMEDICSLTLASYYLELNGLLQECETYLIQNIYHKHFVEFYLLSIKCKLDDLNENCITYFSKNSHRILEDKQFLDFNIDQLKEISEKVIKVIEKPDVKEDFYEFYIFWIKHDFENRNEYLLDFLNLLPLDKVSSKFLHEVVSKDELIRQSLPCALLVIDVLTKIHPIFDNSQSKIESHLFCLGEKYKQNNAAIKKLNFSTKKWEFLEYFPKGYQFAMTSFKNKIFISGGFDNDQFSKMKNFYLYDCSNNIFEDLPKMIHGRLLHGMVYLNGFVYVSGGMNCRRLTNYESAEDESEQNTFQINPEKNGFEALSSMDGYCVETGEWHRLKDMNKKRCGHKFVELNSYLYAIGGFEDISSEIDIETKESNFQKLKLFLNKNKNGENSNLSTVERYDPIKDEWEFVAETKKSHKNLFATTIHGKIYVLSKDSFEVYDPETNIWTVLPSIQMNRFTGLFNFNGQLLATSYIDLKKKKSKFCVYEFDLKNNKWKCFNKFDEKTVPDSFLISVDF